SRVRPQGSCPSYSQAFQGCYWREERNLNLGVAAGLCYGCLIPEKAPETRGRQFGIAHCVLNRLMAEIGLNSSGIDPVIRQLKAAAVPQHVRMDLDIEAGSAGRTIHHRLETTLCEWCAPLADKHKWRSGFLFTLQAPQGA